MQAQIQELRNIFTELLPLLEHHKYYRRIRRYERKLGRLSELELNIAVTFEILPHYAAGTLNTYIDEKICKKFNVNLTDDMKERVYNILEEICKINLLL